MIVIAIFLMTQIWVQFSKIQHIIAKPAKKERITIVSTIYIIVLKEFQTVYIYFTFSKTWRKLEKQKNVYTCRYTVGLKQILNGNLQ